MKAKIVIVLALIMINSLLLISQIRENPDPDHCRIQTGSYLHKTYVLTGECYFEWLPIPLTYVGDTYDCQVLNNFTCDSYICDELSPYCIWYKVE